MEAPFVKTVYSSHTASEESFGYYRAVRKGPLLFVSGTLAIDPGTEKVLFPNDAVKQTEKCFDVVLKAVEALGGKKEDVCRVRMFIANKDDFGPCAEVFKQYFGSAESAEYGVAGTLVVAGFADPDALIEVEADAVVG